MNIYFSGIGGVGIGPLAEIAADAGYKVFGSDRQASLMTDRLAEKGVVMQIGAQDGAFLQHIHKNAPLDWFVYTAALPADHPELQLARDLGIKTAKRDELLAHIIAEKDLQLIAITGTHGKTTTTGMMIWALQQLGIPVSYSVGSTISFGPSVFFDHASKYFVYECDEFDRNFLQFSPYLSLITAIDYDHPDTYPAEAEYKAAFRQFVDQSQQVIMWQQDADYAAITDPKVQYLTPGDIIPLELPGKHNRRNGTLVIKALEQLSLAQGNVRNILAAFPGTDRRFEKLADNLYTDYGHHPAEIAATLQMARELSDHVVLVYQPHQNVRQHEIRSQYTNAIFADADEVYWTPTYLTREDEALETLTPEQLTEQLTGTIQVVDLDEVLWNEIEKHREAGHMVLCMGAGPIDGWVRQQLAD